MILQGHAIYNQIDHLKNILMLISIIVPVYNEEVGLPQCISILSPFLISRLPHVSNVVIVNNGSIDDTFLVAEGLSKQYSNVRVVHLDLKGRGRALRQSWLDSLADILVYMDVDLSTDLESLPDLVAAIADRGYHLSIGSRLMSGSKVVRSLKREIISRAYNFLIKLMFFTKFKDAQCGFKAISRDAAQELIPRVINQEWFFDTELLIISEKAGIPIKEIPVKWTDDPDSRVKVVSTAMEDIRGLMRMRFGGLSRALRGINLKPQ